MQKCFVFSMSVYADSILLIYLNVTPAYMYADMSEVVPWDLFKGVYEGVAKMYQKVGRVLLLSCKRIF